MNKFVRDSLVAYVSHSQHRWEKFGDEDELAVDVQLKLNEQSAWLPALVDLTGWTTQQIETFLPLVLDSGEKDKFAWKGEFLNHTVRFRVSTDTLAVLHDAKINKFTTDFKSGELTFRIQANVPNEDVVSSLVAIERQLVRLEILGPPQAEMFDEEEEQDTGVKQRIERAKDVANQANNAKVREEQTA